MKELHELNLPDDLRYTDDHEWAKGEGEKVKIGITDYAQGELGDVVFVELPNIGDSVEKNESFGTIEAVKAVSDLFSPVSGEITAINENLSDQPDSVNKDPYGEGWMVKIKMSDTAEWDELMKSEEYAELIG